ncbi:hypothetical protein Achl_4294 (plasmid) [Pseudarthrobacter chlorophenolicus A6]|uniref:Uncharacterized protein n=1 Tax=Pseudarthrobacter chlorophenolicus (strain ATCC 700700 / DSM 12829 / CIP 107037 / JCM 12360 / KCTC 9906 / NCIMB 13794 / A6) TaxID=452863 RepID=B8HIJ8_PSECP|nr:hypothetical protein [Pseudarthrobacter chlorophenolicus]ACL42245.1 hypothetical protein Achl_4294 [Pseudarthrobacter chlorophenolicus A6]
METTDSRIDAIYQADPQLRFVGRGTITDVLKAAEATGLIAPATQSGGLQSVPAGKAA